IVRARVDIPYIPGLLAFREAPLMIAALKALWSKGVYVDVLMVNGHGLPHPRKMGIASHIGVALDIPSIGVARKRLYGTIRRIREDFAEILIDNKVVGYVVGKGRRELYISVGHKIEPVQVLKLVKEMMRPTLRYPLPIHYADSISKRVARCARHGHSG
ncbi:MAG: endonuclease V, partial [Thermoprotei archaeon]